MTADLMTSYPLVYWLVPLRGASLTQALQTLFEWQGFKGKDWSVEKKDEDRERRDLYTYLTVYTLAVFNNAHLCFHPFFKLKR